MKLLKDILFDIKNIKPGVPNLSIYEVKNKILSSFVKYKDIIDVNSFNEIYDEVILTVLTTNSFKVYFPIFKPTKTSNHIKI